MRVGVVGISFKTADLVLRESIARATLGLTGEAGLFFAHRTVVLSTCNRTEIYFSAPDLATAQCDLLHFLRREISDLFEVRLYSYFGIDCVTHLCCVTAGLDSAIIAETEIQGQVKQAYKEAVAWPFLPSSLHLLFQTALKIGKKVRSQLPLVRGIATLQGILWEIIRKNGLSWEKSRTLFVGYSQTNHALISYLRQKGMGEIDHCTRHSENLERWHQYDLIICASKAPHYLIHPLVLVKDCPKISLGNVLIFDLSVPRNVHPIVGTLPSVSLYNIEQLDDLIRERQEAQRERIADCETYVRECVLKLRMSWSTREWNDVANVLHASHK